MKSQSRGGQLEKVERKPIHRQVQEAIRDFIVQNELTPGSQLPPEGQLAQIFGVSRNSVREGVKALEVQGVIEARVGTGLFVQPFSFEPILETLPYGIRVEMESVKHLLHLREVLDRGIAHQLVEVCDPHKLKELDGILDEWQIRANDGIYDPSLDRKFHQCLYQGLNNPLLSRIAGLFWDMMHRVLDESESSHTQNPLQTVALHREMVRALRSQDSQLMLSSIDAHYPGIWSDLL